MAESAVTPEDAYWNRRTLLAAMGLGGAASALMGTRARAAMPEDAYTPAPARNEAYGMGEGRSMTSEKIASTYNNFYEFGSTKQIARKAQNLDTDGWMIEIDGAVEAPLKIEAEDLIAKMPVEERVIRHRCVEAWSMVVPWIGFPLAELVKMAAPLSNAKYVQFQTFLDPKTAIGQKQSWYPWPYTEALTIEEAANPLAFMVTGAYGKVLHKQFGAPVRLHTPWKYGFKSAKSIARISFVEERPKSFWEELAAKEYGFWANVNPEVPHPRWSQAMERDIGSGEKIPTQKWNGYGEEVASLYDGMEDLGKKLYF